MTRVAAWLTALVQDPDLSPSSTRVAALLCTVAGIFVAVWGVVTKHEQASTVTALLGGGAATFFARTKSVPGQP